MTIHFELRGSLLMLRCSCCACIYEIKNLPPDQRYISLADYFTDAHQQGWKINPEFSSALCPGCVSDRKDTLGLYPVRYETRKLAVMYRPGVFLQKVIKYVTEGKVKMNRLVFSVIIEADHAGYAEVSGEYYAMGGSIEQDKAALIQSFQRAAEETI